MSGTEEIYFATFISLSVWMAALKSPPAIIRWIIRMKLVREGACPISGDTGVRALQRLAEANDFPPVDETKRGSLSTNQNPLRYTSITCSVISTSKTSRRQPGDELRNGAAGPVVDAIQVPLSCPRVLWN